METGISTASLFTRYKTEDAIRFLSVSGVKSAEVFLESYCEYDKKFGKLVNKRKGNTDIHSVHVLTTQYEPQLYSINERAQADSFKILDKAMSAAEAFGAKYYTFHGVAKFKRVADNPDYDRLGKITQKVIDACKAHKVTLALENVHWCFYNHVGFFSEIKKRTEGLKGTLDVKQARQAGINSFDLIDEMKSDIVTVHLSDIDENGRMCLPGKGTTDFYELFTRLNAVGFNGALLIEAYGKDYDKESELFESLNFINEVAAKAFK